VAISKAIEIYISDEGKVSTHSGRYGAPFLFPGAIARRPKLCQHVGMGNKNAPKREVKKPKKKKV